MISPEQSGKHGLKLVNGALADPNVSGKHMSILLLVGKDETAKFKDAKTVFRLARARTHPMPDEDERKSQAELVLHSPAKQISGDEAVERGVAQRPRDSSRSSLPAASSTAPTRSRTSGRGCGTIPTSPRRANSRGHRYGPGTGRRPAAGSGFTFRLGGNPQFDADGQDLRIAEHVAIGREDRPGRLFAAQVTLRQARPASRRRRSCGSAARFPARRPPAASCPMEMPHRELPGPAASGYDRARSGGAAAVSLGVTIVTARGGSCDPAGADCDASHAPPGCHVGSAAAGEAGTRFRRINWSLVAGAGARAAAGRDGTTTPSRSPPARRRRPRQSSRVGPWCVTSMGTVTFAPRLVPLWELSGPARADFQPTRPNGSRTAPMPVQS